MNNYSNLYGNPETSNLTFVPAVQSMQTPYGDAVDPMQVMSANNRIPTSGNAGAGNVVAAGFNAIGTLMELDALSSQSQATIDSIKRALDKNRARLTYEWRKQDAANTLSFWGSGIDSRRGSAMAALESNRQVVQRNISEMELEAREQIQNIKSQLSSAKKTGAISAIGGVLSAAFSDKRLKTDLVKVATSDNGLNIYLGKYTEESGLDDGKWHLFLIAQEVQKVVPEAVIKHPNGYFMVDYKKALN